MSARGCILRSEPVCVYKVLVFVSSVRSLCVAVSRHTTHVRRDRHAPPACPRTLYVRT